MITINQDLLDRIIYDSNNILAKFKIIDYLSESEQVKMVQLLDENSVALNYKKQPQVKSVSMIELTSCFVFVDKEEVDRLEDEVNHTKRFHMYIKYFAENGECFPLEIRPNVNF